MSRKSTPVINFPMVFRVMGWLLLIEALFMLVPLGVSLLCHEHDIALDFGVAMSVTACAGTFMAYVIKPKNHNTSMRKREGLLLTAIIWVFFSAFGMLPFITSGTLTNVTDAFFETMAGFTTTGSTVIADVEALPRGLLFWRALMQWIGGMGIILFTLAVLPMLNYKGGIALFNAEVTGITHERMRPRVSQTAKDMWLIYVVLTAVLALLLIVPMGWFDGVCHALTTMSTGGFTTHKDGLHYWHSYYIYVVVMVFMFLGGINFSLLFAASRGRFNRVRQSDTFKWYCAVAFIVSLVIIGRMFYMNYCDNDADRVTYAIFDTLSTITSTGFGSVHYEWGSEFVAMILLIMMFFGGMAGSTSGGAKIDRMIVLLKQTANEFYRVLHPNAVTTVRIDSRALPHVYVARVIAFLAIYFVVIFAVALMLSMMGLPMFDSIFTSMSTISNVGLGYGVTADLGSLALLPAPAKWLLAIEMLVGRLELFTVLILFTRTFWVKD